MGALSWARDVIADQGAVDPIPIAVEERAEGCFLVAGVNGGATRIAVDRRPNPAPHPILKEINSCEIAGRTLEAESPDALRRKVAAMLESLAPAGVLPLAYFRAPAAAYELPVYEDDGHIVAHAFGGTRSRARDLAGLRAHVARHLVTAGYIAAEDDLQIGFIDPADLRLIEPAGVLRSVTDADVWMPWADRGAGGEPRVDRLGVDASLENDVLSMLAWARAELGAEGLYTAGVAPTAWRAASRGMSEAGVAIAADLDRGEQTRLELPMLRTADGALAVAVDCGGIDVFRADTPEALAAMVGLRLEECGFLASPERVEVGAAA
ncbi:MAG: hypothetical protein QOJ12_978 [Thermoleophilales bacterium]|nr:hypothetical protein [Thermoleophilales bacterium]